MNPLQTLIRLKYPIWTGYSISYDLKSFRNAVPEGVYMQIWEAAIESYESSSVEELQTRIDEILITYESRT